MNAIDTYILPEGDIDANLSACIGEDVAEIPFPRRGKGKSRYYITRDAVIWKVSSVAGRRIASMHKRFDMRSRSIFVRMCAGEKGHEFWAPLQNCVYNAWKTRVWIDGLQLGFRNGNARDCRLSNLVAAEDPMRTLASFVLLDRYEELFRKIVGYVVGSTHLDRMEAEDVVENAYMEICAAAKGKSEQHLVCLWHIVARNRALDCLRRAFVHDGITPDAVWGLQKNYEFPLWKLIPERKRMMRLVMSCYWRGMDIHQICKALDKRASNVAAYYTRGIRYIADVLKSETAL